MLRTEKLVTIRKKNSPRRNSIETEEAQTTRAHHGLAPPPSCVCKLTRSPLKDSLRPRPKRHVCKFPGLWRAAFWVKPSLRLEAPRGFRKAEKVFGVGTCNRRKYCPPEGLEQASCGGHRNLTRVWSFLAAGRAWLLATILFLGLRYCPMNA